MSARVCQIKGAGRALGVVALAMVVMGCEHYAPNVRPEAGSTEAITRAQAERLYSHSATRTMPPSQIRIATGGLTSREESSVCADWLDRCWEELGLTAEQGEMLPGETRPAPAQSFRGLLPCVEASMACTAQHATLTLFANHTWRARISYLDERNQPVGSATDLQGCWQRTADSPRHFVLIHENGNPFGSFVATSNNTLVWDQTAESRLQYSLTRQPENDARASVAPEGLRCSR